MDLNPLLNKIHLGDCLEFMRELPDNSIDMILCDLPYGTTACKWDDIIPFDSLWEQYIRISKNNTAIVLTASQPFTSKLVCSNINMFKHSWVWDKVTARGHLVAKFRPMQQTEDVIVFCKETPKYYPIMIERPPNKIEKRKTTEYSRTSIMGGNVNAPTDKIYTHWYPKNIISISNASSSSKSIHPTQKPLELFEYLIKTYSDIDDVILDNCSGSGTTAIAANNTNRNFICIEKDPDYHVASVKRLEEHQKQEKLF